MLVVLLFSWMASAQDTDLMAFFDCGALLTPIGRETERVRLDESPDRFFDMTAFLGGLPEKRFALGWHNASELDFLFSTRASFTYSGGPVSREANLLRRMYEDDRVDRRKHGRRMAMIWAYLENGSVAEYSLAPSNDLFIRESDLERALTGLDRLSPIKRITFWIWHPTASPPSRAEVANVRELAYFHWWSGSAKPKVSLNVAGESYGGIAIFEVDIPLRDSEEVR